MDLNGIRISLLVLFFNIINLRAIDPIPHELILNDTVDCIRYHTPPMTMKHDSRIIIVGENYFYITALIDELRAQSYSNTTILSQSEINLHDYSEVRNYFEKEKPEFVFLIAYNSSLIGQEHATPASLLGNALSVNLNIINAAHEYKIQKLLFIAPSNYKNKNEPNVTSIDELISLNGISLCQSFKKEFGDNFISSYSGECYGPSDRYDELNNRFIPRFIAQLNRSHSNKNKQIYLWESNNQEINFLYISDWANACIHLMKNYSGIAVIPIASENKLSLITAAKKIMDYMNYDGDVLLSPIKKKESNQNLDASLLKSLGWASSFDFDDSIGITLDSYKRLNLYHKD